jgi:subtilisin family serine protease
MGRKADRRHLRMACESLENRRLLTGAPLDIVGATPHLSQSRAEEPAALAWSAQSVQTSKPFALAVSADFASDRIIVKFKEPTVLAQSVAAVKERLADQVYSVQVPQGEDLARTIAKLKAIKTVLYAEPDFLVRCARIPDDSRFHQQWALDNAGGYGAKADADIDAPEAWSISVGTGRTVVAVIDSGIDYRHPDLARNMWRNPLEVANGIDDDNNGHIDDVFGADFVDADGDPMDEYGHGTHVAGIIGAVGGNGIGVAGVNWNASIMAVRFLDATGSGYVSNAIKSLAYAVKMGARISNNSWGSLGYSQALHDAISWSAETEHMFVAAAGNHFGGDNDRLPVYPSSFDCNNIVSVASTNREDRLSFFSNFGIKTVDIAAPGSEILSTLPGAMYGYASGTSMAAPHVTGSLCLLMDAQPGMKASHAWKNLLAAADSLAELKDKVASGGRLDVAEAMRGVPIPLAPAELVQGRITSSTVTLSWQDTSVGEDAFRVYSSVDGQSWAIAGRVGPNQTAFTVVGLRERTTYQFRVTAVGQAGESLSSNVVTAKTAASSAGLPTSLRASSIERTSFRLSWSRPSGEPAHYEIWLFDGKKWALSEDVQGHRTSAVIEFERSGGLRLRAGRPYQVKMRAVSGAGRATGWSEVISVRMAS